MRVLVLGGTGSIGAAVVRGLVARAHAVTGLARSAESAGRLAAMGAAPVEGDIRAPAAWLDALDAADAVIHAATTFTDEMAAIDRALLDALLPRLAATGRRAAFVYTGGNWLYGSTGERVADEATPFDPPSAFVWAVPQLRRVLTDGGVRGMVVHPAMVYERDGGVFRRFAEDAKRRGRIRVIEREDIRWPLVHRDDLALLYVLMLERAEAGASYNGAAIEGVPVGRIVRAMARRFGVPETPELWHIEDAVRELGAWACGYLLDQQMSGAKARREIDWQPRHTNVFEDVA